MHGPLERTWCFASWASGRGGDLQLQLQPHVRRDGFGDRMLHLQAAD